MTRSNYRLGTVAVAVLALCAGACTGGGDDDDTGMAGATGSGGTLGTGSGGMGSGGMGSGGMGAGGMGAAGTPTFTPGSPTFTAVFQEIIKDTGCNGGGLCHGGLVGMLKMLDRDETYKALVNVPAMGTNLPVADMNCVDSGTTRVVPGDPDKSLLMLKVMRMPPCGKPMPPGEPGLKPAQVEQIRTWIMNGAMDD